MSEELHSINDLYKEINEMTNHKPWILGEKNISVQDIELINDQAYQRILEEIWIATRP